MSKKTPLPPKFLESMSYQAWKNKIEMWKVCATDIPAKQQAIHVRLYSFEGNEKAEKAVQLLKVADLQGTDADENLGWKNLFLKLDLVFKEEEND